MCGIVGYVGRAECASILVEGLRRLEYRGYDSAGLALLSGPRIEVRRSVGKLAALERALAERPLAGTTGIGHTRWATHGRPSEVNAHPHVVGKVAVVHNGIIENHLSIRSRLRERGAKIQSDTDTELVAHLVAEHLAEVRDLETAVRRAIAEVRGTYALAIVSSDEPDRIVVARQSSPLVVGLADGATLCASDVPALLAHTRRMLFLEDGDVATLERGGVTVRGADGQVVEREVREIAWSATMAEKAGFKHFMLKEIHEQPRALEDTLRGRLDRAAADVVGSEIGLSEDDARRIRRVILVACGTSHHASLVGRFYLESLAKLPTTVEIASEMRDRGAPVGEGDLVVAVSQSGETLDTLIAAREAKQRGARLLAVCNVQGSAITRAADASLYTHAGPEIGVASTKCFTTQVAALLLLSLWLGRRRGELDERSARELVESLAKLPAQMSETLTSTRQMVHALAKRHRTARDILFLGRGPSHPIALEAALKVKEISYAHAEGYAAGEMKHGPIALIDEEVPVVVIAPRDRWHARTLANLEEARARDGKAVAIATDGDAAAHGATDDVVEVPPTHELLSPLLTVLPLQLYAYHLADLRGHDVDQPRNLAKTVTVE
jgi:glucosamine--fructose-6-phosphate aminotransferase (isomerizing)